MDQPFIPMTGLHNPVFSITHCMDSQLYQPNLKYHISEAASYYYQTTYRTKSNKLAGGENRAEALQALLIAKHNLYTRGTGDDIKDVQEYLDQRMPRTKYRIPTWLRDVPFIYPSQKHRLADQVRTLFDHPMTAKEQQALLDNAKTYITASDQEKPLEMAMRRINRPFNALNK